MPTIQVLIPCYNYGMYLEACVRSVLDQERVDVDVLVIDDCSSDDTPQVAARLEQTDRRVRFIRHETNRGHIATYNEGIAQIRGDYFVLLSADDLLTPGSLARATDLMEANPSVGMVYGQAISLFGDTLPPARANAAKWRIWNGTEWIRRICNSGRNFIVSPEAIVRTSIQESIGGYDPKLPHSGDMEMWMRIAAISDIGRVGGVDQAYYRVHAKSMQRTIHKGYIVDLVGRHQAIRSTFAKEASRLPDAEKLQATAARALADNSVRAARMLCDNRSQDKAQIEELRRFALSLAPDIVDSRAWRTLERAGQADKGVAHRAFAGISACARSFVDRELLGQLDYHWSRRTGTCLRL